MEEKACILVRQLKNQLAYGYHCQEEANHFERLWWKGYIECLEHVIKLLKEVLKHD